MSTSPIFYLHTSNLRSLPGTAVYVYAILPLFAQPDNTSTPTATNLTFALDNANAGAFQYNGASLSFFTSSPNPNISQIDPSLLYQANVLVFQQDDLQNEPHSLIMNVGPNSVFLFDRAIITVNDTDVDTTPTSTAVSSGATDISSQVVTSRQVLLFL